MQSTKGMARHYMVLSRVDEKGDFWEVQRFEYIEGDRFKTKKSALRHAQLSRMRWQTNYHGYRDATLTITDTAELEQSAPKPVTKGEALKARFVAHVSGSKSAPIVGHSKSIAPLLAPTDSWPVAPADAANVEV